MPPEVPKGATANVGWRGRLRRTLDGVTSDDAAYLSELRKSTLAVLTGCLPEGADEVIFLDAPTHRNFGDSLIWQGTLNYLQTMGKRVVFASDAKSFRDTHLDRLPKQLPILLQGGGNLGDLWPRHESFRRHILHTFGDRRIILLPQSIRFHDPAEIAVTRESYHHAQKLTVLLRESNSMAIAREAFPEAHLQFCHDLAFGVDVPQDHRRGGRSTPILLARTDKEAKEEDHLFAQAHGTEDWAAGTMNRALWRRLVSLKVRLSRSPRASPGVLNALNFTYSGLAALNVSAAIDQFHGAPYLITNRLHAHILATLMGMPHWVADNNYGKIGGIFREYSGKFSTAHWADSLAEALAIAEATRVR